MIHGKKINQKIKNVIKKTSNKNYTALTNWTKRIQTLWNMMINKCFMQKQCQN